MTDPFPRAIIGAKVRVTSPQNPLSDGIIGTVTRVTRPNDVTTPAYVEIEYPGGRLIVSTRQLGVV